MSFIRKKNSQKILSACLTACAMFGLTANANATLSPDLYRLPASVGNEFLDINGNIRQIIPTSINDDGLMSGMRLTWTPDGDHVAALVGQGSFLYDLNSRSFIAQHILNMAITYVGPDFYIGKRLHPNGIRWQTHHCPLDGLEADTNGQYTNPDCVLIDNDYLNTAIPPEDWAGAFIALNMYRAMTEHLGSNQLGSTLVTDFPDDFPLSTPATNYYRADGSVINITNTATYLTGIFGRTTGDGQLAMQTHSGTSDVFYAIYQSVDGVAPGEVAWASYPSGGSTPVVSRQNIDWIDSNGDQVSILGINEQRDVLTTAGLCNLDDNCASRQPISLTLPGLPTPTTPLGLHHFDQEKILFSDCTQLAGSPPDCANGPGYHDVVADSTTWIADEVFTKFAETIDPEQYLYTMPNFAYSDNTPTRFVHVASRNKQYNILVVRDSAGSINRYLLIF